MQGQGDLADFVEEDRAAVGRADDAEHALLGPGERPADMAEELALEKALADAGTVDGNEGPVGPRALGEEPPGDQFLAGAAFAFDQDATVRARDPIDEPATTLRIAMETPTILGTPVAVTLSVAMLCYAEN